MTSQHNNLFCQIKSLQKYLAVVGCIAIIFSGSSCSPEKIEPTNLGRISRQKNTGSGEGDSENNGDKSGANQSSGAGTGSGNKDGNGSKNTANEKKGGGDSTTEKEIKEGNANADTSSDSPNQPPSDNVVGNTGSGAGENTTAKTGDGNNGTPQPTPAAFPGRPPEKPPYSVAVAIEMADKALAKSKRARAAGDLSAAYRSASEAFRAVSLYANTDQRCREKSNEISEFLESLAKQNPTQPTNGKTTIFQ